MTTSSNAADQSAAAGCDAARQLRETALPLPRGSEQSREEIATVIAAWAWPWCPYVHLPGNFQETALKVADQILALLSTAHAEGLGKEDMASRADSAASLASELTDQQRGAPLEGGE